MSGCGFRRCRRPLVVFALIAPFAAFAADLSEPAVRIRKVTPLTFYSHELDNRLLSYSLDGELCVLRGTKDAQGLATKVTSIFRTDSSGRSSRAYVDDLGRVVRLILSTDQEIRFTWQDGAVLATAIAADGTYQANVSVPIGTPAVDGSHPAAPINVPARESLGSRYDWLARSGHPALGWSTLAGPAALPELTAAPEALDACTSTVTVDQCGTPARDMTADMLYDGNTAESATYLSPISASGDRLTFSMPCAPGVLRQPTTRACAALAGALDVVCGATHGLSATERTSICSALGAGVDLVLGGPTGEGAALDDACRSGLATADDSCSTLGSVRVHGPHGITDALCAAIGPTVDLFESASPGAVVSQARAFVPGQGTKYGPVIVTSRTGPFPDSAVDYGTDAQIGSFVTDPIDPGPFEAYLATVQIACAATNTPVTIAVRGSDGYMHSTTCVGSGDFSCHLAVPGSEEGVTDTVSVTVPDGPNRDTVLLF